MNKENKYAEELENARKDSIISKSFMANEDILAKEFRFEELCKQLKYISQFPEMLPHLPTKDLIRKASLIRKKIFLKGWTDSRIENSILYLQAREIIDEYLTRAP